MLLLQDHELYKLGDARRKSLGGTVVGYTKLPVQFSLNVMSLGRDSLPTSSPSPNLLLLLGLILLLITSLVPSEPRLTCRLSRYIFEKKLVGRKWETGEC